MADAAGGGRAEEPEGREQINSDKDLLEALDLSEADAARLLGRSRQTIYQAKLDFRTDYFKKGDLFNLIFAAAGSGKHFSREGVFSYIARTRGQAQSDELRSANFGNADLATLSEFRTCWVVIPDYTFLVREQPGALSTILTLVGAKDVRCRVFVANDQDAALVRSGARSEEPLKIEVAPWMGAIPFTIIGDPEGIAECYLLAGGSFVHHDWYGGRKLALLLRALVEMKVIPPSDPSALDA